jgi:glycine cleavage system protein P-like pyridoxal-binding family
VKEHLAAFLPAPLVECKDGKYWFDYDRPQSLAG